MNFAGFLRNVKVFDESHGSDSFFYQLAALTIQQHEALEELAVGLTPDVSQRCATKALQAGEDFKEQYE